MSKHTLDSAMRKIVQCSSILWQFIASIFYKKKRVFTFLPPRDALWKRLGIKRTTRTWKYGKYVRAWEDMYRRATFVYKITKQFTMPSINESRSVYVPTYDTSTERRHLPCPCLSLSISLGFGWERWASRSPRITASRNFPTSIDPVPGSRTYGLARIISKRCAHLSYSCRNREDGGRADDGANFTCLQRRAGGTETVGQLT